MTTKRKKPGDLAIILRMPAKLKQEIRAFAKKHDTSMVHVLRAAVTEYMQAHQ